MNHVKKINILARNSIVATTNQMGGITWLKCVFVFFYYSVLNRLKMFKQGLIIESVLNVKWKRCKNNKTGQGLNIPVGHSQVWANVQYLDRWKTSKFRSTKHDRSISYLADLSEFVGLWRNEDLAWGWTFAFLTWLSIVYRAQWSFIYMYR